MGEHLNSWDVIKKSLGLLLAVNRCFILYSDCVLAR